MVTRFNPNEEDPEERFSTDVDLFNNLMMKAGERQVVVITIAGTYQAGKSSLIEILTNDPEIIHGDGTKETTQGTHVYGPYRYNELRIRHGLSAIDNDVLIYFIDTEGIPSYNVCDNQYSNNALIENAIVPYFAISQVILVMYRRNIEINSASNIKELLIKAMSLCPINSKELVHIIPDVIPMKKGEQVDVNDQYRNACEDLAQVIPHGFDGLKASKYVALPAYLIDDGPLEQPKDFYTKFRFAALDIIDSIEKVRIKQTYTASSIISEFYS